MEMNIRTLRVSDQNSWLELWDGYLKFYEADISAEQTSLTWTRLMDVNFNMHGLVADIDGEVVGLAHYSFTNSSWAVGPNLFLEDLFVAKKSRGQGVGKKLILALDEPAKSVGSAKVYWETRKDNAVARLLYDGVADLSEFVTYNRSLN
jgi:GNAT superfamily N-acetyltransferase